MAFDGLVLNDFQSRWLPVNRNEITPVIDADEILAMGGANPKN